MFRLVFFSFQVPLMRKCVKSSSSSYPLTNYRRRRRSHRVSASYRTRRWRFSVRTRAFSKRSEPNRHRYSNRTRIIFSAIVPVQEIRLQKRVCPCKHRHPVPPGRLYVFISPLHSQSVIIVRDERFTQYIYMCIVPILHAARLCSINAPYPVFRDSRVHSY